MSLKNLCFFWILKNVKNVFLNNDKKLDVGIKCSIEQTEQTTMLHSDTNICQPVRLQASVYFCHRTLLHKRKVHQKVMGYK